MDLARKPYSGERKLVLAFDIGNTFSRIAYRYPGQELVSGESKIPTIIYYDLSGKVRAVGAEALQESIWELAEDEEWVKAGWFKGHLNPQPVSQHHAQFSIPPLPSRKTAVHIFADFMKYLYNCAKNYIMNTHVLGPSLWRSVEPKIEYILTHPNGWEGPQLQQLSKAAVRAGLVPDTESGQGRVRLVPEGVASLYFCIENGLVSEPLRTDNAILIVDAGDETIQINSYGPLLTKELEEVASADCYPHGSLSVTSRAYEFLNKRLEGSKFFDDLQVITAMFDRSTKRVFKDPTLPMFIRFGGHRDSDPSLNIRAGRLSLTGTEVASFFQPSIDCVIEGIFMQQRKVNVRIAGVFLVGEFSTNSYLFDQIQGSPALAHIDVRRPDSNINRALVEGAIAFHLYGHHQAHEDHRKNDPIDCSKSSTTPAGNIQIDNSTITAGKTVNIKNAGRDIHIHNGDVTTKIIYMIITDPSVIRAVMAGGV